MTRRPPPAVVLVDTPDEVEAQFYEALQQGDIGRLMALWADDDEIVCIHPGQPRLVGAAAIRASFEAFFSRGGVPVQPERVRRLQQVGSALHHLVERIELGAEAGKETAWLVATNFYVKTALGWRLAAHHASPGGSAAEPTPAPAADAPSTLH
jgi:uncharacterized protein (TIGR02246 family)